MMIMVNTIPTHDARLNNGQATIVPITIFLFFNPQPLRVKKKYKKIIGSWKENEVAGFVVFLQ